MAIGAGIGAIVGGGDSAVFQIYSGGKINWKDVGIDTLYNMFGKEAVLPVKRERRIPRHIIVVHGIMQVFTVFFLILLLFCKDNIYISRIYGMFLFLGCICHIAYWKVKIQNMG